MNEGCEYVCPFEVGSSYGEIGHNGCDAEGKVDIVDCLAAAGPLKIKMRLESASGNDLNHKLKN